MSRKLIIHLGPPKTGTSAIQYTLATENPTPFYYPIVGRWSDHAHHNLAFSVFPEIARPESKLLPINDAATLLRAEVEGSVADVVISTEALSPNKIGRFANFLLQALDGLVDQVLVVLVVRTHVERIASLYNQRVKDSYIGETRSPDDFLTTNAHDFLYRPWIESMVAGGYDARVINYHGHDLVGRFFAALGRVRQHTDQPVKRNVSIDRRGLVTLLEVNRLRDREMRAPYFGALRKLRKLFSGGFVPFTEEAIAKCAVLFREDLDYVEKQSGLPLPLSDERNDLAELYLLPSELEAIQNVLRNEGLADEELFNRLSLYVKKQTPVGDDSDASRCIVTEIIK